MKRGLWVNIALLIAVVALLLFAWLKPDQREPDFKLSTLTAADATSIRIEIAGAAPIVLERPASGWQITAPLAARADNFQVQRLLGILEAKSKDRFPATGLARFELNEPYARVTINQQVFSFGAANPISREQYLLTRDGIYMIDLRHGATLPGNVLQLVSKQLFAPEEAPVAFEFKEFSLAQQDGRWRLTPPAADLSQDDINRWIDEWRLATALAVQPASDRKPLATVKVRLKGGGDITLSLLQREPQWVLARSDQKFEYQLPGAIAQRLLAPPAADNAK
ncbi:MAG TPA: DUF4340 domain-containing protein [Burkholderiales bacterium]|jgi:hypothetical protein|nr:DUF4340 domain-containing protein [Burkholderiales bacterium]